MKQQDVPQFESKEHNFYEGQQLVSDTDKNYVFHYDPSSKHKQIDPNSVDVTVDVHMNMFLKNPKSTVEMNYSPSGESHARNLWWNVQLPVAFDKELNGILMFPGVNVSTESMLSCRKCLGEIHKANVLHTDVRHTNILKFPSIPNLTEGRTGFIIDYDLAVEIDSNGEGQSRQIPVLAGDCGGRATYMRRLLGIQPNQRGDIAWTAMEDYCMFTAFFDQATRLSNNTAVTSIFRSMSFADETETN